MSKPKFPKQIFVTVDPNADEGTAEDLNASRNLDNAVDEHGTMSVAKYELKEVKTFKRQLREVK
jgi:hypothetical protein